MEFDVFFSISQTPVDGVMPDERTMFRSFFEQDEATASRPGEAQHRADETRRAGAVKPSERQTPR